MKKSVLIFGLTCLLSVSLFATSRQKLPIYFTCEGDKFDLTISLDDGISASRYRTHYFMPNQFIVEYNSDATRIKMSKTISNGDFVIIDLQFSPDTNFQNPFEGNLTVMGYPNDKIENYPDMKPEAHAKVVCHDPMAKKD